MKGSSNFHTSVTRRRTVQGNAPPGRRWRAPGGDPRPCQRACDGWRA
ncbi:hypothetical protein N172_18240 [Pantoea dispersa EGD-AAK13]|nr:MULTISPECIES: hypothetical protein [Pantoea]ERH65182.1 hypothetical protein N172_18240 [Pantoea dispersa EGD-AAK13]